VNISVPVETNRTLPGRNGVLVLGQDQLCPGLNFSSSHSFSGELTQVEVWDRVLPATVVVALANCSNAEKANVHVLNWRDSHWQNSNVAMKDVAAESLCSQSPLMGKLVLTDVSYSSFKSTCDRLNGRLPLPRDARELADVHEEIRRTFDDLGGVCHVSPAKVRFLLAQVLPSGADSTEWVDPYANASMNATLWDWPATDTDDEEMRCAFALGPNAVETGDCDDKAACGVCFLPPKGATLRLKGVCEEEREDLDLHFFVHGHVHGKPHFR
jgi:hypothetical protein